MEAPAEIVGHVLPIAALLQDLASDNIAHAYLFVGPPRLGKFTIARWFADALLCLGRTPEDAAAVREATRRLIHPDLLILDQLWIEGICEDWEMIGRRSNVPQEHRKKAGARSDRIGIDDVRVIHDRLHISGSGRYRCCCIRRIERMEDPPANAFLKILEEPPEGRVFLLTADSLDAVLPTVVSRTRVLRFQRLPTQTLFPLVADLPEEDRHFLLHVAQGAPGAIRRLRSDPDTLRRERLLHSRALTFWRTSSFAQRLKTLEPMAEDTEEARSFLLHLALALREEGPAHPLQEQALRQLIHALQTNVQRPLLLQQFALAVSSQ